MRRSKIFTTALALGIVTILGATGAAFAYPANHGAGALTQEQQAAAQELYANYSQATAALQQQLAAKRAELDALYYGQNADNGKAQALYREIADMEAKLFTAGRDLRSKLAEKGLSGGGYGSHMGYAGGYGYGGGYGHGGGHGAGYGHGGGYGGGYGRCGMNRGHGGHW